MTRSARVGHAAVPTLLATLLAAAAGAELFLLVAGVVVLQVLLILGFLALVDAPNAVPVFLLGTAAAAAADAVVVVDDGRIGGLAGVVALGLIVALVQQLARHERTRVTESLADTLGVIVLVSSLACLPAALQSPDGHWLVPAGLFGVGAALVVGRVVEAWRPRARASGLALLGALLAGTVTIFLLTGGQAEPRDRLLLGLGVAAAAVLADIVAGLAAGDVVGLTRDNRRLAALRPFTHLLPFALTGPVLLLATRLLEQG